MSASGFLKCTCQHCGNGIEFPGDAVGAEVACPHCGQNTVLQPMPAAAPRPGPAVRSPVPASSPPATEAPRRGRRKIGVWILLALTLALVALGTLTVVRRPASRGATVETEAKLERSRPPVKLGLGKRDDPEKPAASAPSAPKTLADLKPGRVALEQVSGSRLVYAVGMLTNDSAHRRFDVYVHVALADSDGRPAGTARDHRPTLEPNEVWTFRALILDSRARSGTVTRVVEEP